MADKSWLNALRKHFAAKPKGAARKAAPVEPSRVAPGFGPARSVGPVAPVLAEAAKMTAEKFRYQRLNERKQD